MTLGRTVLARALLVVVLLAGWQAALVHPLVHADEHGHLVHVGERHAHEEGESSDPSSGLCDALAALTACAAGSPASLALDGIQARRAAFHAEPLRRADAPPFLAQGPPPLL